MCWLEIKHYPPLKVMRWEMESTMATLRFIPFLILSASVWIW